MVLQHLPGPDGGGSTCIGSASRGRSASMGLMSFLGGSISISSGLLLLPWSLSFFAGGGSIVLQKGGMERERALELHQGRVKWEKDLHQKGGGHGAELLELSDFWDSALRHAVWFSFGPVWKQELDSVVFGGSFQLGIFCRLIFSALQSIEA